MLSNQIKRLTKLIDYVELSCDPENPELPKLISLFACVSSMKVSFKRPNEDATQISASFFFVDRNINQIETKGIVETESAIRKEIGYCLARNIYSRLSQLLKNPAIELFANETDIVTRIGFDLSKNHLDYRDEIMLIEFGPEKTPVFIVPTVHSGNMVVTMETMLECLDAY